MKRTLFSLVAFNLLIISQMGGQDHFLIRRAPDSTRAPAKTFTCKYKSGDISVSGTGTTLIDARSDASMKCFDRRMTLLEKRGRDIDEEQGLMIIDSCVNINCS